MREEACGKGIPQGQSGRETKERVLWQRWPRQGSLAEIFQLQTPKGPRVSPCKVNNLLTLSLSLVSQQSRATRESKRRTSTRSQNSKAEREVNI